MGPADKTRAAFCLIAALSVVVLLPQRWQSGLDHGRHGGVRADGGMLRAFCRYFGGDFLT